LNHAVHNKLVSFIWSIADDCLRDVYVRGKYRDVILPMVVLRRLDTLLEESKEAVLAEVDFHRNELSPIMVSATLEVANAIITESALSFLGLRFPSDFPAWGRLLYGSEDSRALRLLRYTD
jgi:type I restriction-modification system DNA methylase subunit